MNRRDFIQQFGMLPAGAVLAKEINKINVPRHRIKTDTGKLYDPWLEINLKNIEWNIRKWKIREWEPAMIEDEGYREPVRSQIPCWSPFHSKHPKCEIYEYNYEYGNEKQRFLSKKLIENIRP